MNINTKEDRKEYLRILKETKRDFDDMNIKNTELTEAIKSVIFSLQLYKEPSFINECVILEYVNYQLINGNDLGNEELFNEWTFMKNIIEGRGWRVATKGLGFIQYRKVA